jgi:hypothetical protein
VWNENSGIYGDGDDDSCGGVYMDGGVGSGGEYYGSGNFERGQNGDVVAVVVTVVVVVVAEFVGWNWW